MCLELCVCMLIILGGQQAAKSGTVPLCSGDGMNFMGYLIRFRVGNSRSLDLIFIDGGISLIHPSVVFFFFFF